MITVRQLTILLSVSAILLIAIFGAELSHLLYKFHLFDKAGHFAGFLVLSALVHKVLSLDLKVVIICLIIYSGFTEVGQWLLGYRSGQWLDFVADAIGCLSYALIFVLLNPSVPRKNNFKKQSANKE